MFFLHKDKPKDDNQQDQKSAPATAPVVEPADDDQTQATQPASQAVESQAPDVELMERQVHALANGHPVPEAPNPPSAAEADGGDAPESAIPIIPATPASDPQQVDGMEYEPVMITPDSSDQTDAAPQELPVITLPPESGQPDGPALQPTPDEPPVLPAAAQVPDEPTVVAADIPPITAESTVAQWLDHPVGGVIFRDMLNQAGQNESVVKIVRHMQMQRLVSMSGGRFTQDMLADMVRRANAGRDEIETVGTDTSEPAADTSTTDTGHTQEPDATEAEAEPTPPAAAASLTPAPPSALAQAWQERPTAGRFDGKTIIVTGAGSGIGKAVASRIVREGGQVVAVDISEERLAGLQDELGPAVKTVAGDITSEGTIATIVNTTGDTVHGLANVAGIMDNMTPLHEMSDDIWNKIMNVNLNGMMKLSRAILPLMLANHAGAIVNVGSEASLKASMAGTAYTVSKHAVAGLTKSMAFMYGPSGIRTNMVAPGAVMTNIEASFASDLGAERVNSILATMPAPAEASHLAASICFLLSDDSVNINGALLPSDGGWSVQ